MSPLRSGGLAGHESQELKDVAEAVAAVPGRQDVVEAVHDGEALHTVPPGSCTWVQETVSREFLEWGPLFIWFTDLDLALTSSKYEKQIIIKFKDLKSYI